MRVPLTHEKARELTGNGNTDAIDAAGAFHYMASNDLIKDLTSLFPQYAPNYFSLLNESELASVTYDGKIMGIPAHIQGMSRYCVVVRKSLIDRYNITEINDFNELERFLKVVKEKEPDYIPFSTMWIDEQPFFEISGYISPKSITGIVYKADDPEMKLIPWEETQEFTEVISMLKRWGKNGYISGATSNKKRASYLIKVDKIRLLYNYENNITDWAVFPLYPEQSSIMTSETEKILVILKNSPNAVNVLMCVEWVHSNQKNYDFFMYGEEGRNYTKDSESGKLKRISKAEYEGNMCFTNINYMRQFDTDPYNLVDFYMEVSKLNEVSCPHNGFNIEDDLMPEEIWHKRIDLSKGMRGKLYDIDIAEYQQKLKDVGTYKLVQYMQRELDKWREERK